MEISSLLALARLSTTLQQDVFGFTTGGDAVYSLPLPAKVWVYIPLKEVARDDIKPALEGLEEPCRLVKAEMTGFIGTKPGARRGRLQLKLSESVSLPQTVWLCADKKELPIDELFFFHIKGLKVMGSIGEEPVATVVDYYETGAGGILVSRMEDGKEVLLPLRDELAEFQIEKGMVIFRDFNDYVV